MSLRVTMGILMCISLVSCIAVSLHPVYTKETLFFDARLCGVWCNEKDEETVMVIRKGAEDSYVIVQVDSQGNSVTFKAHLAKRDDTIFLDMQSHDDGTKKDGIAVPVHIFVIVEEIRPKFRTRSLNDNWLEKYLKKKPDELKHEIVDGNVIITASSVALQKFLIKHKDTEGAFNGEHVMAPMKRASNKPDAPDKK